MSPYKSNEPSIEHLQERKDGSCEENNDNNNRKYNDSKTKSIRQFAHLRVCEMRASGHKHTIQYKQIKSNIYTLIQR